ncbi:metal-dependent hydrolase [Alkalihalophilus marmarensis]|uniref:Membrane protein n=1 Tax=Alkalihalophilus marmarensis DSM 21297 TaxID=1188261 RepID=U6SV52_9BACI|nr:metal-dependent hydrolase [Alkalihalophilus marmarensis]ERN54526.1 membrane protein [Alkalihalophilus marmarensis DSM 21297]MCM3490510.1 metal-dependent hydrolase [Alkalihalophilus marmarensis]MEC2070691.1 metal-dependent hydrolase [Alkalihalophilus marmarensis]
MTGKTHVAGGLALCMAADTFLLPHSGTPLYYVAGMAGALIPDICHIHSKIGRRLPLLSRAISSIFGHRTLTHSLLFLGIWALIFHVFFAEYTMIRDGLIVGMISHIILDASTVRGVRLFYPLDFRVRLPFYIRTGGAFERVLFLALSLYIVIYSLDTLKGWL